MAATKSGSPLSDRVTLRLLLPHACTLSLRSHILEDCLC